MDLNCGSEIVEFSSLNETVQNLIKEAVKARSRAYCPYSNFAVGAAILVEEDEDILLLEDDRVYTGCNIESSTLSPTICAERTAAVKAISEGCLKFKMVAVVAHQNCFTAPCGLCRQTLSEFRGSDGDIDIYMCRPTLGEVLCTKLSKLLPLSFVSFKKDNIIK